jgi:hypothetical protein
MEPPSMLEGLSQFWQELIARPSGPLAMRFYLQPLMATVFAIRDGIKDAREQKPAYFWALFTDRPQRGDLLRDGWKSIGKIVILAILLDVVYQFLVLHQIHILEALVVAMLLAVLPYLTVRGPINRLIRRRRRSSGRNLAA